MKSPLCTENHRDGSSSQHLDSANSTGDGHQLVPETGSTTHGFHTTGDRHQMRGKRPQHEAVRCSDHLPLWWTLVLPKWAGV